MAWARSRLRRTNLDAQEDSPPEAPTFLDDLVSGVSSFIASVFGFFDGPVASTSANTTANSRSHHRPRVPGTYNGSDSGMSESDGDRGRRRAPSPLRGRRPSSHHSTDTFSTLSSIEGSSCSSCWTSSRPPTPLPRFRDPIERAPSPEYLRDTVLLRPNVPSERVPISQEVYDLFQQMDVDGSFAASPLLTRLVGDAVLRRADELGIDKKVWATAVVAAYLKIHLQGEPDLLELVSEKAREFVEAELTRDGTRSFDQMVREAAALLPHP